MNNNGGGGGGNVYGVIGQPLTRDYLAKQLPLFQQRVPRSAQGSLKFTTNAPPNLPVPPLYPGEEVQLQEHRVVCTETFNEPAVGALYVTNFRVIFCGNLISDPESLDSLQSANYSGKSKDFSTALGGETATTISSKIKDKFTRKPEPNFTSFLYADNPDGEVEKDHSKNKFKMNSIRRTIGSLRRSSPRSRIKTATLPPPSHPPPLLDTTLIINPVTSDDLLKRRGVNFDPETASQDSSSLSEFSSTTGTDERSVQSPLREFGEGPSTPIDININGTLLSDTQISPTLIPDSGYKGDGSLDVTMDSSKYQLLDSGVNLMKDRGNTSELTGDLSSIDNHSPMAKVDLKKRAELRKRFKKAKSVDTSNKTRKTSLQKSLTVDVLDNKSRKGSRRFWENSLVLIESDSDSDDSLGLHSSTSPPLQTTKSSCYSQIDEPVITSGYSKIEVLGPRNSSKQEHLEHSSKDLNHYFGDAIYSEPCLGAESTKDSLQTVDTDTRPYANMEIARVTETQKTIHDAAARARSKSSSPRVPKKPKPLPRILLQQEDGGRSELVTSLPTDFRHHPFGKVQHPKQPPVLSPPPEESTPPSSSDTTQSSPEHPGDSPPAMGNSLAEPAVNQRGDSPTPVPPPRRKRKTTRRLKSEPQNLPLLSPPIRVNGSHDRVVTSHDIPNKAGHNGTRKSLDDDFVDLQDPFLEDVLLRDNFDTETLTSHTSMTALPSSRPHSVVTPSAYQNTDFAFTAEDRGSVAYRSLPPPRSLPTTWSPRSELISKKKKQAITASSTRYTLSVAFPLYSIHSVTKLQSVHLKEQGLKLPEGLLILCRTSHSLKLHVHPHNTYDAESLRELLERTFVLSKPLTELFAFQYYAAIHHPNPTFIGNRSIPSIFKLPGEMERLGLIGSKLWRVARILNDHPDLCPTYPPHVIMPICTPDMDIIRGASLYKEGRFPTLTWLHPSGTALLRAATTKDERGQGSSNFQIDEALLKAICACSSGSKGPATLFVFTEKGVSDNKHSSLALKPEEVRSYYYHNCKFVYSEAPPTYKSVRHSFNKLQALLESKLPDEDYLLALDSTKWLQRVGELLSITNSVVNALTKHRAHVLVAFDCGWDRTTQVVSLAQLLVDPFFRTMNGFQILVQKEWVWFGHPFRGRHSYQGKTKIKSDGPIFLQWLDAVWQVMRQCPSAFEFNDKFLMCLAEESYSGRFGTFMTDCENMRKQSFTEKGYEHMSVSTHTVSYWTWVAMVNSVGTTFYNDLYDPALYPSVIVPSHSLPRLRLWTTYYCRYKTQDRVHQPSVLLKQLEVLLGTYKKLESQRVSLEPSGYSRRFIEEGNVPPPLMPRDELFDQSLKDHYSPPLVRSKPTPPPKPATNKPPRFHSIEQYLQKEGLDSSLCKQVELRQTICQGNLVKIGGVRKNWLQRWFVLDFDCQYLAYFENKASYENREVPKGVIRLTDITKVYQNVKKKDHLMRNIITIETSLRTYLVQAPSISTMYIWQTCLSMPPDSFGDRTN